MDEKDAKELASTLWCMITDDDGDICARGYVEKVLAEALVSKDAPRESRCADCGTSKTEGLHSCHCGAIVCKQCRIDYHENLPRLGCAFQTSRKLLEKYKAAAENVLSPEESKKVMDAINAPPQANEALKAAFKASAHDTSNIAGAAQRACEVSKTLLDALSWIAVWENDRAVAQAFKWKEIDGGGWDTCFKHCFEHVVKTWNKLHGQADLLPDRPAKEARYPDGTAWTQVDCKEDLDSITVYVGGSHLTWNKDIPVCRLAVVRDPEDPDFVRELMDIQEKGRHDGTAGSKAVERFLAALKGHSK